MDVERLRSLFGRLVALNERHEIEHVGTPVAVDTSRYASRDRHERELQKLFREQPQLVAFSSDLPAPNTFATGRVGDVPLLLVRDGDGVVRAFVNACRHRGAPVAQGSGSGRRLSCPYHGWTYDLDGRLTGVPDREAFVGCIEGEALPALPVAERYGFVVVCADPTGRADVDDYLGDMAEELAHFDLATLSAVNVHEAEVAMNWKLGNDAAMEAYHVPVLHKQTVGPMTRVGYTYDAFGAHHRMGLLSVNAATDGGGGEEAMELLESLTLVHHLFPSSMLVVGSGIVVHQRCDPGRTPDTCWLRVSTYAWAEPPDDEARAGQQMLSDLLWKVVLEEDCWVQQGAQQAFSAGAIDRVVFGANEPGLRGMHTAWDAALR